MINILKELDKILAKKSKDNKDLYDRWIDKCNELDEVKKQNKMLRDTLKEFNKEYGKLKHN